MKRKFFHIMVSLACVGAIATSCAGSEEEFTTEKQSQEKYSRTLISSVTIGKETRSISEDGKKVFKVGEQIAVRYTGKDKKDTRAIGDIIEVSSDGKTATFSVTLEKEPYELAGEDVYVSYIYPASMSQEDGWYDDAKLKVQDGTFEGAASREFVTGGAEVKVMGTGTFTLPESVDLEYSVALAKFTIKDEDNNDITSKIDQLTIKKEGYASEYTYTINRTSGTEGPIWVTVKDLYVSGDYPMTFNATAGYRIYTRVLKSKSLANGSIYPITVKVEKTKQVNLDLITSDYTAEDGDILVGTTTHQIVIPDGINITLKGATIKHEGNAIVCNGDAGINFEGSCRVENTESNSGGHAVIRTAPDLSKTLTINGASKGELQIWKNSSMGGAGIGTDVAESADQFGSNIKIESGYIRVYPARSGTTYSVGIGAGGASKKGVTNKCGDITISGGKLIVYGGSYAAGIGTGSVMTEGASVRCGNITISGDAEVEATGGSYGAAIGVSQNRSSSVYTSYNICGDITISTSKTLKAVGGQNAAGIGKGYSLYGYTQSYATSITIADNVTVDATKGEQGDTGSTNYDIYAGYYREGTTNVKCPMTIGENVTYNGTKGYELIDETGYNKVE